MKKLLSSSQTMLVVLLASITIISASSYSINEAMAFPHASITIETGFEGSGNLFPNTIDLVLGHTNEPAFGKLPGIHDGKHNVEVLLEDSSTVLPVQNGELFEDTNLLVDKYYFKDLESFQSASDLTEADDIELDRPLSAVFGDPGHYVNRQVIDPGIYGYTVKGTINYYGVSEVPIQVTKFCDIADQDLTKFDYPKNTWQGSYGCPTNIKDIFFPSDSGKYPYPPDYDDGYDYGNNGEGYDKPKEQYQSYGEDKRERPY
jgi:hypothetical protein